MPVQKKLCIIHRLAAFGQCSLFSKILGEILLVRAALSRRLTRSTLFTYIAHRITSGFPTSEVLLSVEPFYPKEMQKTMGLSRVPFTRLLLWAIEYSFRPACQHRRIVLQAFDRPREAISD